MNASTARWTFLDSIFVQALDLEEFVTYASTSAMLGTAKLLQRLSSTPRGAAHTPVKTLCLYRCRSSR